MEKFVLYIFLTVLVFLLDKTALITPLKNLAQTALAPGQSLIYQAKTGVVEGLSVLTFWRSGENRIKNLEQRLSEAQILAARAKALEEENRVLRQQLRVTNLPSSKALAARVLGLSRDLEIGVGASDGVKTGQMVVVGEILVGRVRLVSDHVSYVQLPIDPQAKIPAKVNRARGLVTGRFNSSVVLEKVAQNEEIQQGDLVLTSGEGEGYQPDLVIGKIATINNSQTDLFKSADVNPLVGYKNLSLVFVLSD